MRTTCFIGMLLLWLASPITTTAKSNSTTIDSLTQELTSATDTSRVLLLIDLAFELPADAATQAIDYGEEALELAKLLKYNNGLGEAHYVIGYLHHLAENFEKAEAYYTTASIVFKEEQMTKQLAETYNRLAHLLTLKGEYQRSIEIYEQALELAKAKKDSVTASVTIFSMANSYAYLGELEQAYELMLSCRPLITHKPHLIHYFGILGGLYAKMERPEEGLAVLLESRELCIELKDELRQGYISQGIAETYVDLGDYQEAAKFYSEVIRLNEKVASKTLLMGSYLGLGNLYNLWKVSDDALQNYEKALMIMKQTQVVEKIPECLLGMGDSYLKQGEYEKALEYFEKSKNKAIDLKNTTVFRQAQLRIGKTHFELKNYALASATLSQLKNEIPVEAEFSCMQGELHLLLSHCFLALNDIEKGTYNLNQSRQYLNRCTDRSKVKQGYHALSENYRLLGDYHKSKFYYQKYSNLNDSLNVVANGQLLIAMRAKMGNFEKEEAIKLLQKEKEIQQLNLLQQDTALKRKNMFLLVIALLFFISLLMAYHVFSRYKLKKGMERLKLEQHQVELEKQNLENNKQLELAELRSNFFTAVSHEFRTPLTLLLTPLADLIDNAENAAQRRNFLRMQRNANRLMQLVKQTLNYSKLQAGRMPMFFEQLNFNALVTQIVTDFDPLAKKKQVNLELDLPLNQVMMQCDKDKVIKMMSNLLSNALKNTKAGGEIRVELKEIKMDGFETALTQDGISLSVMDNGVGIAKHHLPHIFERYYQVDGEKTEGHGIGLALTKELINRHAGKIEVETVLKQGTTFRIILPIHQQANPVSAQNVVANSGQGPALKKLTNMEKQLASLNIFHSAKVIANHKPVVLVVEDNEDMRAYIEELLLSQAYQVLTAEQAEKGMQLAIQHRPNLIITDVMMPGQNGFDFASQLKTDFQTSHIPVVILTAKATHQSKMNGLDRGADDYITKPFRSDELLKRCANLINQRNKLKALFAADPFLLKEPEMGHTMEEDFLKKAISLVELRISDSAFNVERFAQEIGMSRTNLYNKIRALTGKNISEFIKMIRLRKAAELIEKEAGNFFEIAMRTGFNSRQSFNKSFKNLYGLSPTEFKKSRLVAAVAAKN